VRVATPVPTDGHVAVAERDRRIDDVVALRIEDDRLRGASPTCHAQSALGVGTSSLGSASSGVACPIAWVSPPTFAIQRSDERAGHEDLVAVDMRDSSVPRRAADAGPVDATRDLHAAVGFSRRNGRVTREEVRMVDVVGSRALGAAALWSLATAALAATLGSSVATAGSEPLVVAADRSGGYGTIADAVATAADGDTILVRPGTYTEPVVLDKDVTVRGDGPPESVVVSFGDGRTPVVAFVESDAVLSNLTIHGPDSFVSVSGGAPVLDAIVFDGVGLLVEAEAGCHANFGPTGCNPVALDLDGTAARVTGNAFVDSGEIRVHGGAEPAIEGNDASGGSHIFLEEPGDEAVVRGNQLHDLEKAAIVVWSSGRPLIEGNEISDVGGAAIVVGLQLAPGIEPTIRGNAIIGASTGIEVAAGSLPTIESNTITGNTSGIVVVGSDAVITANELADNASGVFVMRGAPRLEANSIMGGKVGLGLGSDEATPILVGNTICDNETNLSLTFGAEMPATEGNELCADEPSEDG
jgi:parallel beta-helix repeat protein